MNSKQAEAKLRPLLKGLLSEMDFSYSPPLNFVRRRKDHSELLLFGGRMDRGRFLFNFRPGIRFFAIEEILRPEQKDPTYPTVSGSMRSTLEFVEWGFGGDDDLGQILEGVREEVATSADAFFARYSSLKTLESEVRSSSPGTPDWFVLDPIQRSELLAAIAVLEERRDEALKFIDEALGFPWCKGVRRKKLEGLKSHLVG